MHIDDARHYLVTTSEKFDAITSDPLDPWVKGAATLYTREFFEVAKSHLNPGGVVTLFVQLYESSPEAVKSEVATFFEVFPDGVIFGNTFDGHGYDTVLVGQVDPPQIDVDAMRGEAAAPEYAPVARRWAKSASTRRSICSANYAGRARSAAVARRRGDQPRSRPAAAVPGGARVQSPRGAPHLPGHARVPEIS